MEKLEGATSNEKKIGPKELTQGDTEGGKLRFTLRSSICFDDCCT